MAEPPSELIGPAETARMLSLKRTAFYSLRLTERFAPATIDLCGPKWRKAEVLDWIAAGCPHRKAWAWKGGRS